MTEGTRILLFDRGLGRETRVRSCGVVGCRSILREYLGGTIAALNRKSQRVSLQRQHKLQPEIEGRSGAMQNQLGEDLGGDTG